MLTSGTTRLATCALLVLSCGLLGCSRPLPPPAPPPPPGEPPGGAEAASPAVLAQYRTWTLVNPKPVRMAPAVAVACAAAIPIGEPVNPHSHKYILVYVNDFGRAAMLTQRTPRFPAGTVIVKEKLDKPGDGEPELLTVMVKRSAGYDPPNGDWEYLVLDGRANQVLPQHGASGCQGCHATARDTDFVMRSYLPPGAQAQLR